MKKNPGSRAIDITMLKKKLKYIAKKTLKRIKVINKKMRLINKDFFGPKTTTNVFPSFFLSSLYWNICVRGSPVETRKKAMIQRRIILKLISEIAQSQPPKILSEP